MKNLVHKHSMTINKPKVFMDRKQKSKQGYRKHKTAKQGGFILSIALRNQIFSAGHMLKQVNFLCGLAARNFDSH